MKAPYATGCLLAVLATGALASGFDDAMLAFENKDYPRAQEAIEPLAKAGNAAALTLLGRIREEGYHDVAGALPLYRQAAEKGFAEAQVQLAELYDGGDGVPRDAELALRWYERAAQQGNEEAQLALGLNYADVRHDNLSAFGFFQQAADQGNVTAQYRLGLLYLGDVDVPRDDIKAWVYLSLASEKLPEADQARSALELNLPAETLTSARVALSRWIAAH